MSDDDLSCRRVRGCSPSMAAWPRSQLLNGTHIDRPTLQGEKSTHETRTNNAKTLRDAEPSQVFTLPQHQDSGCYKGIPPASAPLCSYVHLNALVIVILDCQICVTEEITFEDLIRSASETESKASPILEAVNDLDKFCSWAFGLVQTIYEGVYLERRRIGDLADMVKT